LFRPCQQPADVGFRCLRHDEQIDMLRHENEGNQAKAFRFTRSFE